MRHGLVISALLLHLVLSPGCASAGPILRVHLENRFVEMPAGVVTLSMPVVAEDSARGWDGTVYTIPVAGVYRVQLQVYFESVPSIPSVVGVILWSNDNFLAWTPVYVTGQAGHLAAAVQLARQQRFQTGDRLRVGVWTPGATVAGFPYESWLTIEKTAD